MLMIDLHPASLLRIADVEKLTSLSRSTIYRRLERSLFPAPVKLGRRCTRWRAGDLLDWLAHAHRTCQSDNSDRRQADDSCHPGNSAEPSMRRVARLAT